MKGTVSVNMRGADGWGVVEGGEQVQSPAVRGSGAACSNHNHENVWEVNRDRKDCLAAVLEDFLFSPKKKGLMMFFLL